LHVRYARLVSDHEDAIEALRVAARPDRPVPAVMQPYVEKVRSGAYRVTDGDVNELRAAGFSEDEIFEQTVSAAVSEGLVRLDAALRALG
jgi:alkylhydroperoxidase family enzyme